MSPACHREHGSAFPRACAFPVQTWRDVVRQAYEAAPVEALRRWLRANVEFVATKKGMAAALALAAGPPPSELTAFSYERLTKAIGALLARAVEAGEIRDDIGPGDLLRALVGMCLLHDQPGWQKSVLRLLDVFIDGLRSRRAERQTNTKKHQLDWHASRCPKWGLVVL